MVDYKKCPFNLFNKEFLFIIILEFRNLKIFNFILTKFFRKFLKSRGFSIISGKSRVMGIKS